MPSAGDCAVLDADLDTGGVGEAGGRVTVDACLASADFEGGCEVGWPTDGKVAERAIGCVVFELEDAPDELLSLGIEALVRRRLGEGWEDIASDAEFFKAAKGDVYS